MTRLLRSAKNSALYRHNQNKLIKKSRHRGYPKKILKEIKGMTHNKWRQVLHILKCKTRKERPLPFVTTFEKHDPTLNTILHTRWEKIYSYPTLELDQHFMKPWFSRRTFTFEVNYHNSPSFVKKIFHYNNISNCMLCMCVSACNFRDLSNRTLYPTLCSPAWWDSPGELCTCNELGRLQLHLLEWSPYYSPSRPHWQRILSPIPLCWGEIV